MTQNFFQNCIGVLQCIVIPKADYPKAFRLKISRSFGIAGSHLSMLPAIEFHYKLFSKADEINDIWWNRMLSSKFESAESTIF